MWHGATLPFLLFGLLHAGFLLVNHAWRAAPRAGPAGRWLSVALTYLCVLVGSVVFRATTVGRAGSMLAGMAGLHGTGLFAADLGVATDVLWLLGLYAIVWFAPTTRQWMLGESPDSLRLAAIAPLGRGRWGAPRRWGCSPPGAPANSCISGSDPMRYLRLFGLSAGLSFALVWGWVAAMPMAFMDAEYASWRAKQVMLDRCDLGDVIILGDSRAAADIIPARLPVRVTNLAVGGAKAIEALSVLDRALTCPSPPRLVIISLDPGHFSRPDMFWERSVRFGVVTGADIAALREASRLDRRSIGL